MRGANQPLRTYASLNRLYSSQYHLKAFARSSSCSGGGGLTRYEFAPSLYDLLKSLGSLEDVSTTTTKDSNSFCCRIQASTSCPDLNGNLRSRKTMAGRR